MKEATGLEIKIQERLDKDDVLYKTDEIRELTANEFEEEYAYWLPNYALLTSIDGLSISIAVFGEGEDLYVGYSIDKS